jgi:hypothetical protein
MRASTRGLGRRLSGVNRTRDCGVSRAVATRNTISLAAEEAATEAALPKDVQRVESHASSAEIRLLWRPKRALD